MNNNYKNKTFAFAVRIVNLYKYLTDTKKEWVMSKQLLRCGTSVGANYREAEYAESKADFVHKLSIVQKESSETIYWLELLHRTEYLTDTEFNSIFPDAEELLKIVTSMILTAKKTIARNSSKSLNPKP